MLFGGEALLSYRFQKQRLQRVLKPSLLKQAVALLASYAIGIHPAIAQSVTTTPISGDLNIYDSASGVPVVDIVDPNSQGVSHNIYGEFNVGEEGLIFNNADQNFVDTNLGGQIYGNGNLTNGPATVILNEVLYNNPTELLGYMEVAGHQADVIIANPYGITCNGCGFINTDKATLTTGTPFYEGGDFRGFNVTRGAVAIGELGVDGTGASQFDIISRQIKVGGTIYGQNVRLIAGQNNIIYATGVVTERDSDGSAKPELAIDSTVLGGMYANSITIISNEDGVGVKAPTNMAANAGEMTITADGRLVMGTAQASSNVNIQANQDIIVQNQIYSQAQVNLEAARDLIAENNAQIVADGALAFQAGRDITLGDEVAVVSNGESLALNAGNDLTLSDATMVSNTVGVIDINAAQAVALANSAKIMAVQDVTFAASSLTSSGDNVIAAGVEDADGNAVAAKLDVDISGDAELASSTVYASGDLFFDADSITIGSDSIDPSQFISGSNMALTASTIEAEGARLNSANDLAIASNTINTADATLQAQNDINITGPNGGNLNIIGGNYLSGNALSVEASSVTNSANLTAIEGGLDIEATSGSLNNTGELYAGDNLNLTSVDSLNNEGSLTGLSGVTLTSEGDLTNSGDFLSSGVITMTATNTLTNSGSGVNTASGAVDAESSTVLADGTGLVLTGASVDNSGDTLIAGDITLSANASDLTNRGDLTALGAFDVNVASGFDNSGDLYSATTLDINAASMDNSGNLTANDALTIDISGHFANTGNLHSNTGIGIEAGSFDIGGALTSRGTVQFAALSRTSNITGSINALGAIDIDGASDLNLGTDAKIFAWGDALDILAGGKLTSDADLYSQGAMMLSGSSLDLDGLIQSRTSIGLTSTAGDILSDATIQTASLDVDSAGVFIQTGDITTTLLTLDALDAFENTGSISTAYLQTNSSSLNNSGTLDANVYASLTTTGNFTNSGTITAVGSEDADQSGNILINAGSGNINNSGTIDAASLLSLTGNNLTNQSSGRLEGGRIGAALTDSLTNQGQIISDGTVDLSADQSLYNTGTIQSGDLLKVSTEAFTNNGKIAVYGGAVAIEARTSFHNGNDTIFSDTGIQLRINGGLDNSNYGTINSLGFIDIAGLGNGYIDYFNVAADDEFGAVGDYRVKTKSVTNAGAIYSASGNLTLETQNDITNTGVIYSGGDWMQLLLGGTLDNNGGAVLAMNNMAIAGIGYDGTNNDRAAGIINQHEGRIETIQGNMILAADSVENLTEAPEISEQYFVDTGESNKYAPYNVLQDYEVVEWKTNAAGEKHNGGCGFGCRGGSKSESGYFIRQADLLHKVYFRTDLLTATEEPSQIRSAGNLTIIADDFSNEYSLISARNNIDFDVFGSATNEGASYGDQYLYVNTSYHHEWEESGRFSWTVAPTFGVVENETGSKTYNVYGTITSTEWDKSQMQSVYGTIEAGGNITGNIVNLTIEGNVDSLSGTSTTPPTVAQITSPTQLASLSQSAKDLNLSVLSGSVDSAGIIDGELSIEAKGDVISSLDPSFTSLANDPLFEYDPDGASGYLIETAYEFIDQSAFVSSDYFLGAMGLTPASDPPLRLGDAFVETTHIRDQLFEQVGVTILNPDMSEAEQIQVMYDNAVDASQNLELRPGVSLTPDQQAALTEDIIWMETQIINGQEVLVPTVYLANGGAQYASLGGSNITAGGSINLDVDTLTNNGGTIRADEQLIVNAANDIINNGGILEGGVNGVFTDANGNEINMPSVLLQAGGNVENYNGTITGADVAISAENIINETTKTRFGGNSNFSDIAGTTATIGGTGNLSLIAINDIMIKGADVTAGGNGFIQAGGNVTLAALEIESSYEHSGSSRGSWGHKEKWSSSSYDLVADTSTLSAGGNLTITSTGGNIISVGADLVAGKNSDSGTLALNAENDITLTAAYDVHESRTSSKSKDGFGTSGEEGDHSQYALTSTGTSLTGDNITLNAGNAETGAEGNITLIGADLNATNDIAFSANGDIAVLAAIDRSITSDASSSHGFFQGGGNGFLSLYGGEGNSGFTDQSLVNGSSINAGGNITFDATGSMLAEAADVQSGGDLIIDVDEALMITGVANTITTGSDSDQWGIGVSFSSSTSGVSLFAGYQGTETSFDQQQVIYTGSNFVAGGDLTANAGSDIIIAGSTVAAGAVEATEELEGEEFTYITSSSTGGNLSITSDDGSVNVIPLENFTTTEESFSQTQIGVTVSVSSSTLAGIDQMQNGFDVYGQGQGNLSGLNDASAIQMGVAGALDISQNIITMTMAKNFENNSINDNIENGMGLGASIGIGFNTTSTSSSSTTTSQTNSSLMAFSSGNDENGEMGNVSIDAGDDINIIGSYVYSDNDTSLIAEDEVNILSAQDSWANSSSSDSFGMSLGWKLDLNNPTSITGAPTLDVNGSTFGKNGAGVTQVNSDVMAGGELTIQSGGDTNIIGGTASGETLNVDVGGDLTVASVQDIASSSGSGANFSFSTTGSASIGGSDSGSDYAWVTGQSGLTATGEADIKVEGHTQLDGGVIGSETEDALDFETGTFASTDIFDNDEAWDNSLTVSTDSSLTGTTGSGDLYNHDKEQTNFATVAGGDVVITDEEAQAELAANAEEGVNTDPDAVNTDLDNAQVITKDETNSATVYIDGAAIEEIGSGFETIREALDFLLNRGLSAEQAALVEKLMACTGEQTASLTVLELLNYLIASPAYAEEDCSDVTMEELSVAIDEDTLRALILACSDPEVRAKAQAFLARKIWDRLPVEDQIALSQIGNWDTETVMEYMMDNPDVFELVNLIAEITMHGGMPYLTLANGNIPLSTLSAMTLQHVEVPTESGFGVDTTGWPLHDFIMLSFVEHVVAESGGALTGGAISRIVEKFGPSAFRVMKRAFGIADNVNNPDEIAKIIKNKTNSANAPKGTVTAPNLTERGTLTNLHPSDTPQLLTTKRKLVQDESGRYWLESANGNRVTPTGSYDFVTMPDGTIYAARSNTTQGSEASTHLGLSQGGEVSYAGSMTFPNRNSPNRGNIQGWSNNSGHYQPPAGLSENSGLPTENFNPVTFE